MMIFSTRSELANECVTVVHAGGFGHVLGLAPTKRHKVGMLISQRLVDGPREKKWAPNWTVLASAGPGRRVRVRVRVGPAESVQASSSLGSGSGHDNASVPVTAVSESPWHWHGTVTAQ
jgi:hypothetical protein